MGAKEMLEKMDKEIDKGIKAAQFEYDKALQLFNSAQAKLGLAEIALNKAKGDKEELKSIMGRNDTNGKVQDGQEQL